jgi:hypothetical protein
MDLKEVNGEFGIKAVPFSGVLMGRLFLYVEFMSVLCGEA